MSNLENFQDLGMGYGSTNRDELIRLMKALQANTYETNIANLQGGGALQVQSLESTLVVLTAQENNANFLRLWKNIPKDQAYSTVEEYTTQLGYGMGDFGWSGQLDLPNSETDPYFKREFALVKFIRSVWKVSDVSTMVKNIADPEIIAKRSSLMRALRTLNESLYWGDSNLIPEMIDGFEKVITSNGSKAHVIDARNGLSESHFQQLAEIIVSNFGNVEGAGLYVSPAGMSALSNLILPGQRFLLNQLGTDGKIAIGYGIDRIRTNYGTIIPQMDLSIGAIYEGRGVPTIPDPANPTNRIEGPTSSKAPNPPANVTITILGSQPNSNWVNGSPIRPASSNYRYRVAAGNKYGLSQATAPVVGSCGNGGGIQLTITKSTTGEPATFFEIYSEKNPNTGEYRLLKRIPAGSGASTVFVDLNHDIPGTTRMFLLDFTSTGEQRACAVKRLAPALSQELAKIGPFRWGYTYLYLTPVFYAPLRFAMIKNVDVSNITTSIRYDM